MDPPVVRPSLILAFHNTHTVFFCVWFLWLVFCVLFYSFLNSFFFGEKILLSGRKLTAEKSNVDRRKVDNDQNQSQTEYLNTDYNRKEEISNNYLTFGGQTFILRADINFDVWLLSG